MSPNPTDGELLGRAYEECKKLSADLESSRAEAEQLRHQLAVACATASVRQLAVLRLSRRLLRLSSPGFARKLAETIDALHDEEHYQPVYDSDDFACVDSAAARAVLDLIMAEQVSG